MTASQEFAAWLQGIADDLGGGSRSRRAMADHRIAGLSRPLANLAAQQHEALKEIHDHQFAIGPVNQGHDCKTNKIPICQALQSAKDFQEKYRD